jgi:hypothetical protein
VGVEVERAHVCGQRFLDSASSIEDGQRQYMHPTMGESCRSVSDDQSDRGIVMGADDSPLQRCGASFTSAGISPCSWSQRQNAFSARSQVLQLTGLTPRSRRAITKR